MSESFKGALVKGVKHPRTRPWLMVAAEVPATFAAHAAWADSPPAAMGLTLAAGGVTVATWLAGKGSHALRRVGATISAGAASGYLLLGTAVTEPWNPALLSALGIGGPALAVTWNIIQALRTNPDAAKGGEKGHSETGVLTKAIGSAKVALRGKPKVEPNKVTADLQLSGGEVSVDELGNRIKHIAGELGVSPNSVKILADPDHADRATLVVIPEDMLKQATPWPGPSALGGSITDPVVIGIYEDGESAQLWFPWAQGRNATHFLTAGMNGSGKSAGVSVAMTEVLTRRDVIVWAIDPSKGLQTFGPFLPHLDWVEMTASGGEAMIDSLTQVITARANEMGKAGFKNWTPEVHDRLGMPYMVVWIEEAARFFRDGTEMEGLVMEARSAGISVIISLQRPSSTSMPTDVREQLGGALVFGVKGGTTADMALPEDVRDAGARPEVWQNRRPGYAYLVAPGVDEERYPFPMRTFLIADEDIEGVLAIAPRPTADPVTAAAAGDAYADRARYDAAVAVGEALEDAGVDPDTVPESLEASMRARQQQEEADREAVLDRQVERAVMEAAGIDTDAAPDPDVDPDREIPPVPANEVWSLGQPTARQEPRRRLTPGEAEAELLRVLEEFRAEDRELIGPRDFAPHWGKDGRLNRSRAWLSERLGELADAGIHLAETQDEGTYRLLHPEHADA
ncbi:conjugal transfer protein TraB [Streptomyces sp. NPDC049879]|uniref:conjugal transfer protein TraB n=1 Tax=Streptomyces sp. NPDC049879 TaxID=3365598 RepID=UPI00379EEA24